MAKYQEILSKLVSAAEYAADEAAQGRLAYDVLFQAIDEYHLNQEPIMRALEELDDRIAADERLTESMGKLRRWK